MDVHLVARDGEEYPRQRGYKHMQKIWKGESSESLENYMSFNATIAQSEERMP